MSTPLRICYQVQRPGPDGRLEVVDARESLEEAKEALAFYKTATPSVAWRLVRYEVFVLEQS